MAPTCEQHPGGMGGRLCPWQKLRCTGLLVHVHQHLPMTCFGLYVDAVQQLTSAANISKILVRNIAPLKVYTPGVRTIGLRMSLKSNVVATSTQKACHCGKRGGVGPRCAKVSMSLGVDITRETENTTRKTARARKAEGRNAKVKKTSEQRTVSAHLQQSSQSVTANSDAAVLGASLSVLKAQRGRLAVHVVAKPGWCNTTLLEVQSRKKKERREGTKSVWQSIVQTM